MYHILSSYSPTWGNGHKLINLTLIHRIIKDNLTVRKKKQQQQKKKKTKKKNKKQLNGVFDSLLIVVLMTVQVYIIYKPAWVRDSAWPVVLYISPFTSFSASELFWSGVICWNLFKSKIISISKVQYPPDPENSLYIISALAQRKLQRVIQRNLEYHSWNSFFFFFLFFFFFFLASVDILLL